MLSPSERKKNSFTRSLLPSFAAEMKKYEEVYQLFITEGYSKELCDMYAEYFVDNVKKPVAEDIINLATFYNKIYNYRNASFYLEMLAEKKLSGDEKFNYCIEMLRAKSKLGKWRDAEDFRTENINFMQNYSQKKTLKQQANMYIALALTDCAAKKYNQAFKLMKFGYKPHGRNDTKLLEIMITGVYIFACSKDVENLEAAIESANACLNLFSEFKYSWSREYYKKAIEVAAKGIE